MDDGALNVWKVFSAWQFWAAGIVIQFTMQTLARATDAVSPAILTRPLMRSFVATQPFCFGVAIAALPGFLPGATFAERAMVGIADGALSHLIYATVLKRFSATTTKPDDAAS